MSTAVARSSAPQEAEAVASTPAPAKEGKSPKHKDTIRMNISIPAALRARMGKFDDVANWSCIAAKAFTAEVERLECSQPVEYPYITREWEYQLAEIAEEARQEELRKNAAQQAGELKATQ